MNKELNEEIQSRIGADLESLLPAEFLLDETHPANQSFMQNLRSIDGAIRAASHGVKPQIIRTAQLAYKGFKNAAIAEEVGVAPSTVASYKKTEEFHRIIALLVHREQFSSAPTQEMKENLLWEIAINSKKTSPGTSVSAVEALNRMEQARNDRADRLKGLLGAPTTVIINPDLMPKTSLDELPTPPTQDAPIDAEFTEADE